MPINSKDKGASYEREIAEELRQMGIEAQRGVQYQGSPDSPDIKTNTNLHIECKRTERFVLYSALSQAKKDASADQIPVVIHRMNNKPSVLVVELCRLKDLVNELKDKLV